MWRLCPACGYARTENARTDTSPCPRCGGREIADAGCVQYVMEPKRVIARDKRDDARVRDDKDERDRRRYAMLTTVDIDPVHLAPGSWRHETAVFGVDFTRRAVIRTLNLGLDRQDGGSTVPVAGDDVRLNPFYVCTSCGGATADGRPVVEQASGALTESLATSNRASAHHLLWCPRRKTRDAGDQQGKGQDVPLLLAHELVTEAVRILLPASVARAKERLASFTAALFVGIAARYGGDPDHIDIASASMPDGGDADWPRRFLVVYDRLPGGTGYLHRLASADGFREVLLRAREVIESCPCIEKGMDGCHRCLLRRVPAGDYDRVSRNEVRQMFDELLGKTGETWKTSPVAATHHIPLERQAESDLEVMFIETLKEWAGHPDSRASADAYTTTAGTYSLDLRLTGADGSTLSWRVSQQRALDGTRPDVLFERLDAPGPRLALYLDGYEFHATPKHNRLADDAAKRTRLRAEGLRVFQLTYFDVKEWRTRVRDTGYAAAGPADPVWHPYGDLGTQQARKYYDEVRGACRASSPTRSGSTRRICCSPICALRTPTHGWHVRNRSWPASPGPARTWRPYPRKPSGHSSLRPCTAPRRRAAAGRCASSPRWTGRAAASRLSRTPGTSRPPGRRPPCWTTAPQPWRTPTLTANVGGPGCTGATCCSSWSTAEATAPS